MIPLREGTTSQEIPLGYFLDDQDGVTQETGLTINNTDIKLWKNGATSLANKNSGGATHISNGIYYAVLDDNDTDTIGPLKIFIHVSGALPVVLLCNVYSAKVYDSLFADADNLEVDATQVAGSTSAATNVATGANGMVSGTIDDTAFTPTATEFEADDITEATADHYVRGGRGRSIMFTSGALKDQVVEITSYALVSGRGHFTTDTLTEAPANNDTFIII